MAIKKNSLDLNYNQDTNMYQKHIPNEKKYGVSTNLAAYLFHYVCYFADKRITGFDYQIPATGR